MSSNQLSINVPQPTIYNSCLLIKQYRYKNSKQYLSSSNLPQALGPTTSVRAFRIRLRRECLVTMLGLLVFAFSPLGILGLGFFFMATLKGCSAVAYPNGLTPECVSMWIFRFDLFLNIFGHLGQWTFGVDDNSSRFDASSVEWSPPSESANDDRETSISGLSGTSEWTSFRCRVAAFRVANILPQIGHWKSVSSSNLSGNEGKLDHGFESWFRHHFCCQMNLYDHLILETNKYRLHYRLKLGRSWLSSSFPLERSAA